jgi:quinol monooxygenase YgiN
MKKIINARMIVKADEIGNFIFHAEEIIKESNLEPGCNVYKLFQEVGNSTSFIFYEEYENQSALDFHNSSLHLKKFLSKIRKMLLEKPQVETY